LYAKHITGTFTLLAVVYYHGSPSSPGSFTVVARRRAGIGYIYDYEYDYAAVGKWISIRHLEN